MDSGKHKLYSWAIPDVGQPLDDLERSVIDAAFDLVETLLGGRVVLIMARPEGGGWSFMEPHQSDVDFERVYERLRDAVEYFEDRQT